MKVKPRYWVAEFLLPNRNFPGIDPSVIQPNEEDILTVRRSFLWSEGSVTAQELLIFAERDWDHGYVFHGEFVRIRKAWQYEVFESETGLVQIRDRRLVSLKGDVCTDLFRECHLTVVRKLDDELAASAYSVAFDTALEQDERLCETPRIDQLTEAVTKRLQEVDLYDINRIDLENIGREEAARVMDSLLAQGLAMPGREA